jgi:hypothetical protein
VLHSALAGRRIWLPLCVVLVAANFGALSFWARPASRPVPVSWVAPVYSELFAPPASPWDGLIGRLRREPPSAAASVVGVLPAWSQDIVIFYLGDRYLVPPVVEAPTEDLTRAMLRALGESAFRRLFLARPDWIVDAGGQLKGAPAGYQLADRFPSFAGRPDEGARPELTRHTFAGPAVVADIDLYRRQAAADPQRSQP